MSNTGRVGKIELDEQSLPPQLYDLSEGYGSVYGRYVRKHQGLRLIERNDVRSILEVPCNAECYFASPGTQSVPFAQHGCAVTLLHPDEEVVAKTRDFWNALNLRDTAVVHHADLYHLPFCDNEFDLVWNFDSIPLFDNPPAFIREMARVSRKLVMVIVGNLWNIGYPIHRLVTKLQHRASWYGSKQWMEIGRVEREMSSAGLTLVERGPVDMPPWPGFDALHVLMQLLQRGSAASHPKQLTDEEMERMMNKLTFIEYGPLPTVLKVPFAHQIYLVGRKV